jgi:hypothetical protein
MVMAYPSVRDMSLEGNDIGRVLEISHGARDGDSELSLPLELGGGTIVPGARQMFIPA